MQRKMTAKNSSRVGKYKANKMLIGQDGLDVDVYCRWILPSVDVPIPE